MMIPEAWENHEEMDPARRAFYEFHSTFMEPWDGPACVTFTDGSLIGAVLDRNGLRPGRYSVTDDGLVVLASEAGVLDLDPRRVVRKGRLQPGRMFLVDTEHGRIVSDDEVKASLARPAPLRRVAARRPDPPRRPARARAHRAHRSLGRPSPADLRLHAGGAQDPAHADGQDRGRGRSARWAPTPRSPCCPQRPAAGLRLLHPAVRPGHQPAARRDPRGARHLARARPSAPRATPCRPTPAHARQVVLPFPVIDNDELAKIVPHQRRRRPARLRHARRPRPLRRRPAVASAMQRGSRRSSREVSAAIADGARFVVLSDRDSGRDLAPIPSLLLTSAVHHHLIREKTRTQVGLLVEAGDVREVHHVALLVGYGAAAVNPYLAMESVEDLVRARRPRRASTPGEGRQEPHQGARQGRAQGHVQDGHLDGRVLPRRPGVRGDRPVAGARRPLLHRHDLPARRRRPRRHRRRRSPRGTPRRTRRRACALPHRKLEVGGEYQWRREGEPHLFDPETVFRLQHSTRAAPLRHLQAVHRSASTTSPSG